MPNLNPPVDLASTNHRKKHAVFRVLLAGVGEGFQAAALCVVAGFDGFEKRFKVALGISSGLVDTVELAVSALVHGYIPHNVTCAVHLEETAPRLVSPEEALVNKLRQLAENTLNESVYASFAPLESQLFVRTAKYLYCIQEDK